MQAADEAEAVATSQTRPCCFFIFSQQKHATSLFRSPTSLIHHHQPLSFFLHALVHISTADSYHHTTEIVDMHSHLVATAAIGLMASLAVAQDGISARILPYTDRKLLTPTPSSRLQRCF